MSPLTGLGFLLDLGFYKYVAPLALGFSRLAAFILFSD
jgi:hypothetical protein